VLCRHAFVYLSFSLSEKRGSPDVRGNLPFSRFWSQAGAPSIAMHTGKGECALSNRRTEIICARSVAHSGLQMALDLHRWGDTARINRQ